MLTPDFRTVSLATSGRTQSESNLRIGKKDTEKKNTLKLEQKGSMGVKMTHLNSSDVNSPDPQIYLEERDNILYQNQNDDQMFKPERACKDIDPMPFLFDKE